MTILRKAAALLTGIIAAVLIHSAAFAAETKITVVVDGMPITFEQEPIIVEGRVMAPVGPIAEALGWSVDINEYGIYLKTHGTLEIIPDKIFYTYYNSDIGLTDGELHISHYDTVGTYDVHHFRHNHYPTKAREICPGEKPCSLLDEEAAWQLTVKPFTDKGTLFVAIRDLANAMYATTDWDNGGRTATIISGSLPYYDGNDLPDDYRGWLLERMYTAFKPHGAVAPWDDPEQTEEEFLKIMEAEVLRLVNEIRTGEGLNPLSGDPAFNVAAKVRAEEIKVEFSHTRPNGESLSTAYESLPFSFFSENILKATMGKEGEAAAKFAVDVWMDSPGHRTNILYPDYTHLAVSASRGDNNVVYCAQGFMMK